MTNQSTATQGQQNTEPDAEAAAKLRRVLSVAEPRKAPAVQPAPAAPKR